MKYFKLILALFFSNYFISLGLPAHAKSFHDQPIVKRLLELPLEQLQEIVVVAATGSKQPMIKAPAVVSLITAEDIKAMGATDLDDVLNTIPELHVSRMFLANTPSYLMRGMYSEYTPEVILLINNIPLNTIQYGNRHLIWGGMPVNVIERIEVIRGSGASVYGADALAGVINIVTKNNHDIKGTEVGSRWGNFNTKDLWVLHGAHYAGFDVAAMWEYHNTEGHREIVEADRQTALDEKWGTHASMAPGPLHNERLTHEIRLDIAKSAWRWRAGLQKHDRVGRGVGSNYNLDSQGTYQSHRFSSDLTYHNPQVTKFWEVMAQLNYLDVSLHPEGIMRNFPPGVFGENKFPEGMLSYVAISERQLRFNLSAFYTGLTNHTWRLETGYTNADVYQVEQLRNFDVYTNRPLGQMIDVSDTTAALLPEMTRLNAHLLVQDAWTLENNWELTTGLRYYNYSDFGQTVNPRLGLVWQSSANSVTKLLYGKAFRAPALMELYTSNAFSVGNPDLNPETIQTIELAWIYNEWENLQVNFDLFKYWVEDAIILRPTVSGRKQFFNEGSRIGNGLGLEVFWQAQPHWKLTGHYSFQAAKDQDNHAVPNTPQHQLYFRSDWAFWPHWNLDVQANWVGKRYRMFDDLRSPVAAYSTVDLTLRYHHNKQPWEVGLSIRNLFDTAAREPTDAVIPYDLPLAGRNFWLELGYQF